jgi:hypothetical protein
MRPDEARAFIRFLACVAYGAMFGIAFAISKAAALAWCGFLLGLAAFVSFAYVDLTYVRREGYLVRLTLLKPANIRSAWAASGLSVRPWIAGRAGVLATAHLVGIGALMILALALR